MVIDKLKPGVTIKFPLSLKFSTVKKNVEECSLDAGPLALTLVNGKTTSAVSIDFMPHTPGGVNYCESNKDVMSGIFTGCIMSTYKFKGRRRVAHVHTGLDAGPNTDCKDFMKGLMKSADYMETIHFKPFDGKRDAAKAIAIASKTKFGASGCCVFGLVTANNKCYSIFTQKIGSHEYLIEDCVDVTAKPYRFA